MSCYDYMYKYKYKTCNVTDLSVMNSLCATDELLRLQVQVQVQDLQCYRPVNDELALCY